MWPIKDHLHFSESSDDLICEKLSSDNNCLKPLFALLPALRLEQPPRLVRPPHLLDDLRRHNPESISRNEMQFKAPDLNQSPSDAHELLLPLLPLLDLVLLQDGPLLHLHNRLQKLRINVRLGSAQLCYFHSREKLVK